MRTNALSQLSGHTEAVGGVDFHPRQGAVFCTASDDHRVTVWDISAGSQVRSLTHRDVVCNARFLVDVAYDHTLDGVRKEGEFASHWELAKSPKPRVRV